MKKKFVFPCIALASLSTLIGCKGGGEKEKTEFTVTFNTQKGTEVPSQTIKKGEKVIKPDVIPTRGEDEAFAGWYTSPSEKEKYNFDNTVNSDFTLYAQYTSSLFYIDGYTDVDILNTEKHKFTVKDKDGKDAEGFTYGVYFPDFKEEETEGIKIDPNTGVLTQCLVSKYVYGYVYAYKQLDGESYVHAVKEVEFASYDMLKFDNGSVSFNKDYKFDDEKFRYNNVVVIIPEYYVDSNKKLVKVKEIAEKGFDKDNFKYDKTDRSIHLPDTIETIGEEAFNVTVCTQISNMPKSIKIIGRRAFCGCKFDYMNKDFSDTKLETIGEEAFFNVDLRSMSICLPASLKSIGARAFSVSDGSSISRPHFIDFKDPYYFSINNGYMQYVVLTNPSNNAEKFFKGGECCESGVKKHERTLSGIKYEPITIGENTRRVVGLDSSFSGTEVSIPSTIVEGDKTYTVTEIGENAFENQTKLTNIYLPESLVKINDSAFAGCTSLSSIYIPKNVNSIGKHVFNGCPLGKILVDSQNQTYRNYDDGVDQSTIYSMDHRILYYGSSRYYDKRIQMHPDTEIICEDAFNGRNSIQMEITIPNNVKEIGKNAFKNCFSEKGNNPQIQFQNGSKLWTLNDGTVLRANDKKLNVTNLCTTYVNNTWKRGTESSGLIYKEHHDDKTGNLDYYEVKNNKDTPCTDTNIMIADLHNFASTPYFVKTILPEGFKGCQMETVSLPSSLLTIYENAFEGCSKLKFIVIPKACTRIDGQVFKDCDSLTEIYFEDTEKHWTVFNDPYFKEPIKSDVYVGNPGDNAIMFKTTYVNNYWEKIVDC